MKKILLAVSLLFSVSFCFSQNTVADIEFGKTSYEEAIPKLTYRFGEPVLDDNTDRIVIFSDITYAGMKFNRAWFCFESSSSSNVFNKCWLISGFDNATDAKAFRDKIISGIEGMYDVKSEIDPQSKFKKYYVGTSPTDPEKPFFRVSVYKEGNRQYTTVVEYGPFEYFKESF